MADGIFDRVASETGRIELGGTGGISQNPEIVIGYGAPPSAPQPSTGSIYLRRDAPNAALMLYVAAGGAWLSVSATVFSDVSVANEAALTAFDASALPDGAQAFVQSHRSYWTVRTQALTLRANELIASSQAARQWIREPVSHLDWALQYAPNVFVDSVAGNNENDGLTNVTALLNMEEVARRVPVLVQPIVVNYVGAGHPATAPSWNPIVRWLPAVSATQPTISILGVETTAALPANANGVVNTATNGTAATNTPPRFTDTGGAAVTWVVGTILRVTSGASIGAWAVVLKDADGGAGTARTSFWRTPAGTALATPPLNGDTYKAVTLTTLPDFMVFSPAPITVTSCKFTRWLTVENAMSTGGSTYSLFFCDLPSTVTFIVPASGTNFSLISCKVFSGAPFASVGALFNVTGCAISTVGGAAFVAGVSGRVTFSDCVLQGCTVAVTSDADTRLGGSAIFANTAIFDSAAATALLVERFGTVFVRTALWGAGNLGKGTQVRSGGRLAVKAGITPTLASTGQELELQNAATAIPALTAGAVVPNASALTTWAQWAAAPFSRNVTDFAGASGSSIIDSA